MKLNRFRPTAKNPAGRDEAPVDLLASRNPPRAGLRVAPRWVIAILMLTAVAARAQETFPGLKAVLSELEWKRAGLDRLTPDELGVIDAALIRHQSRATTKLQTELASARVAAASTATAEEKRGWLQRFGLPLFDDNDWRSLPPLQAKVVKWESANRFKLDNGQVWEGFEPITYELVGKNIEIQARPHGQFNLVIEGQNTTLRVMRLR